MNCCDVCGKRIEPAAELKAWNGTNRRTLHFCGLDCLKEMQKAQKKKRKRRRR